MLHDKEEVSPSCPPFNVNSSRKRWRVLQGCRPGKSRMDGLIKIGDEDGDGLEISQERLKLALAALNNWIHEHKEL